MQSKYGEKGLVVLGFPCNQFGLQENSDNSEILPSLKYVRPGNGFEPNFQMFEKIFINGHQAHDVYRFMRGKLPDTPLTENNWVMDTRPNFLRITPCLTGHVQWNFEKFLMDRNGIPIKRYTSKVQMDQIIPDVEMALGKQAE